MKTNRVMDEIRSTISPEMKLQMELSVAIANRIYEILEAKGMSQKDFATLMGKVTPLYCMQQCHNFQGKCLLSLKNN